MVRERRLREKYGLLAYFPILYQSNGVVPQGVRDLPFGSGEAVGFGEEFGQEGAVDVRQADEDPGVVGVVVGQVEDVGVGGEQARAVGRGRAKDERLAVLFQSGQELAADFEGGSAVGGAFFDARKCQR